MIRSREIDKVREKDKEKKIQNKKRSMKESIEHKCL